MAHSLRECTACKLRENCLAPVGGLGDPHSSIMLIGEAPGENEDKLGKPFQGNAGKVLGSFLQSVGLTMGDCYITNLVKCRPTNNRDPEKDEVDTCTSLWLDQEIEQANPDIICTLGGYASRYVTRDPDLNMEKDHGIPRVVHGRLILPMYHPAAGLHQGRLMRFIQDDFNTLGEILRGREYTEFIPQDEHPDPVYEEVTSLEHALSLLSAPCFALDTETVEVSGRSQLWSIQVTDAAGKGYFIPASLWGEGDTLSAPLQGVIPPTSKVIVHNYLYDARFIEIPNPIDTMIAAWLLQLPKGLKTLAYTLCGMDMKDYMEYVRPWRSVVALQYLKEAAQCIREVQVPVNPKAKNPKSFKTAYVGWQDPPPIQDWEWDNKVSALVLKEKHPQNITKKIMDRLKKCAEADPSYDPYKSWKDIDPRERAVVEDVLGPMRDAGLHDVPREQAIYYASRDPDATWRVAEKLIPMLREKGLWDVFKMEMQMLPVILEMMQNGMTVDVDKLHQLSKDCLDMMQEQANRAAVIAGYGFNPNSADQVRKLVYEELGHAVGKKTKKGKQPSTDDKELSKIDHPVIKPILEYRKILKVRSSYAEKLPAYVDLGNPEYSVIHPNINLAGTDTGRLTVTDPPLQTIPVRTELGKRVRSSFIAKPGRKLYFVDLSQIEMRILAHVSGCENLISLFRDGGDIHTDTAVKVFGVDREAAKLDKYRKPIKNVNFGVVYGISAQGLLDLMAENEVEGWTLEDCENLIRDYFRLYPEIQTYTQHVISSAYDKGYTEDLFGRIRYIPELQSPMQWIRAEGERAAGNMPIQSGAAGYFKLGIIKMMQQRDRLHIPFKFLMQIHDEIVAEIDEYEAEPISWVMEEALCSAYPLKVPILAESKAGYDWGSASSL